MRPLDTFIKKQFRPDIEGGTLDKEHKTRFIIDENVIKVKSEVIYFNAICFGPKKDNVLINIEHAISRHDDILIFYYEDIHLRWTYSCDNGEVFFIYKKNDSEQYRIKPHYLYIRGCYIETKDKHWRILGDFFSFIALWDGKVLCAPKRQMTNESKLYQLNNSLHKSAEKSQTVSIGKSYVVKGISKYNMLPKDKSYIVKSLSGVRSIVVDKKSYSDWDYNSIENIPVLFQEKAEGNDLRVHVISNKIFSKISNAKDNVDYRYDKAFFNLTDVENLSPDLVEFCLSVSKEEKNDMLGIDFIRTDHGYVVLEANPSPGWSAYYPYDGITINPFLTELLAVLKND